MLDDSGAFSSMLSDAAAQVDFDAARQLRPSIDEDARRRGIRLP